MTHLAAVPAAEASPLDRYARILDLAHSIAPSVGIQELIADLYQDLRALADAGSSTLGELERVVSSAVESVITALEIELAGTRAA